MIIHFLSQTFSLNTFNCQAIIQTIDQTQVINLQDLLSYIYIIKKEIYYKNIYLIVFELLFLWGSVCTFLVSIYSYFVFCCVNLSSDRGNDKLIIHFMSVQPNACSFQSCK